MLEPAWPRHHSRRGHATSASLVERQSGHSKSTQNETGCRPKRNGVGPPFRFRRGLAGRQALVSLGISSKRNEMGVFGGVTGKALRQAPPYTPVAGKDPYNPSLAHASCEYARFVAAKDRVCKPSRCIAQKCLARRIGVDTACAHQPGGERKYLLHRHRLLPG